MPRAWHGAGTKRMLEEEGSKGGAAEMGGPRQAEEMGDDGP